MFSENVHRWNQKIKLNKYFETVVLFIQFEVARSEAHRMQVGLSIS